MSGPWEQFQQESGGTAVAEGPWTQFQAQKPWEQFQSRDVLKQNNTLQPFGGMRVSPLVTEPFETGGPPAKDVDVTPILENSILPEGALKAWYALTPVGAFDIGTGGKVKPLHGLGEAQMDLQRAATSPLGVGAMATGEVAPLATTLALGGYGATQIPGQISKAREDIKKGDVVESTRDIANAGLFALPLVHAGLGGVGRLRSGLPTEEGPGVIPTEQLPKPSITSAKPNPRTVVDLVQETKDGPWTQFRSLQDAPKPIEPTTFPEQKVGSIGAGIRKAVEKNKERGSVSTDYDLYQSLAEKLRSLPGVERFTSDIPKQLETLKNKYGGFPPPEPRYTSTYQESEKVKRGPYVLEGPMVVTEDSGFATDKPVEGKQVMGRLENLATKGKLSPTELQTYKDAGLEKFVGEKPRTPGEVSQWMQDNGPRVEVRKFGQGAQSKEQIEKAQLQHWADSLPNPEVAQQLFQYHKQGYDIDPTKYGFTEEQNAKLKRMAELENVDPSKDQSHWQSIAPKSEKDMPGYVEIAVTKPLKGDELYQKRANETRQPSQQLARETGVQFPSSHSFPPNTLVFGRGYMETLPNGKKVFHVIEVQSDWAQRERNRLEEANNPENPDTFRATAKSLTGQEPLLHDYERLGLKALIEHARKEGADAIAISDAETAMMTEGHDRGFESVMFRTREEALRQFPHGEIVPTPDGEFMVKEGTPSQSPGMRLHYDNTLPRIAKELTGSEGERISLGEHQMAFDKSGGIGRLMEPRKDLIFREPSGEPKTSVTARMYPLTERKEPFSLFGKDRTRKPLADVKRSPQAMGITPQMHPVVEKVVKDAIEKAYDLGDKVKNHLKTGKVREAVTFLRDAADNKAKLYTRESVNSVKNALDNSQVGNKTKAEEALTFVREANGDMRNLTKFEKTLNESKKADPFWRNKALNLIDFARQNWDYLRNPDKMYKDFTDSQFQREESLGLVDMSREGYVYHAQDVNVSQGFFTSGFEGEGSFKKMRVHPTYADSIAAGVKPESLNALDLLESRLSRGERMVNKQVWVDSFRGVKDPVTDLPLVTDVEHKVKPNGKVQSTAPNGYTTEYLAGNFPVAVHNGYAGLFETLTDPSWLGKHTATRAIVDLNAGAKVMRLGIDTFHLFRLATWNAVSRAASVSDFKLPKGWSYQKGLALIDYDEATIKDMVKKGQLPESYAEGFAERKQRMNLLVDNGLNVGRIVDSMHQGWLQKLPLLGKGNHWIFDSYQRGVMSEVADMEFARQRGMKGNSDLSDQQVARKVAKDVNTRFGNIGRQGWFKSRTAQDWARLFSFAPQWNESLIKSEWGAVWQGADAAKKLAMGKGMASGLLFRSVATLTFATFVGNQLLNMYFHKKPTWENEEEGEGAKLSAKIPDFMGHSDGFFLHPMGMSAEVSKLLLQKWEKDGSFKDATADYAKGRFSTLDSFVYDWLTKSKFDDAWPLPIPTKAALSVYGYAKTGEVKEEYPGAVQKQVLSSLGVRTDMVPPGEQGLRALAKTWNEKQGFKPKEGFYTSNYQKANDALVAGNEKDFLKEIEPLKAEHPIGPRDKPGTLLYYYHTEYPKENFTHKDEKVEMKFRDSLTEAQRKLYDTSKEKRVENGQKAIRLIIGPSRLRGFEPEN